MNHVTSSYHRLQNQIQQYAHESVEIMAVSKKQSAQAIKQLIAAGGYHVGENQLQEALPKIAALQNEHLTWHFIGTVQSNKTRKIAENFSWVDSVASLLIADRLNAQRPEHLAPLNICMQVNIDQDPQKDGVNVIEVEALATHIERLPRLKLRGLMTVLEHHGDREKTLRSYKAMRKLYDELNQRGYGLDTLSMGMSDDYELAVLAGATMVRIGTAIFGARN
jgi:pyridoxal phosphate enzyme (YggS family)